MSGDAVVYVVDDDASVREGLKWLIESVGLRVKPHASAQEFVQDFDDGSPGCLVLDVRLRGMSGLDLQSELAKRGVGIPTIIITGHGDVPMAVRAMKLGAVDFVEKPFNDQALLAASSKRSTRTASDSARARSGSSSRRCSPRSARASAR